MWTRFKAFAPLVQGFLGMALAGFIWLIAIHIYIDHKALHEVIGFLNANAAKIGALPAPGK